MRAARRHLLWIAALVAGCSAPQPHNPNDPNEVSAARQPFVVRDYLRQVNDVVNPAVLEHKITDAQGRQMTAEAARDYLSKVHFKDTPPNLVWMVAQAYMTAHEWNAAKPLVERALRFDNGPDRHVNDTLWLARCQAELGDVDAAIATARSTFDTPTDWKWPILYSVLYEIAPAAVREKPGERIEIAHLVEDSIKQHEAATGDASNPSQRGWVDTRNFHISRAWNLVEQLYNDAGRPDLARAAAAKALGAHRSPRKTIEA